ncbi:hypothetical protein G4228_003132 [Cervus hanglu yarkandensis]|nr:hypothetical protein G4228_003132 [Cervus hanglu yarkandensis]
MEKENCTAVTDSTLLRFSDTPELRVFLFLLFLSIYGATVLGNLGMIALIQVSSRLHIPMYLFLSHLYFVDFCYPTIFTPNMLANILNDDKAISFLECAVQFYLFCTFVVTMRIINTIDHFFCESSFLLSLSCSDTYLNQLLLFILSTFSELSTLFIILLSYVFIIVTILKMPSACGRRKALSTCTLHLTAISIFQGIILFLCCVSSSTNSRHTVKVVSAFYTVVIPMLNPLIYSLRNKNAKDTFSKIMSSKLISY